MNEISYAEAGDARLNHIAVSTASEADGTAPALAHMHWLPLARGRYVDTPVTGSDGQNYLALLFEMSLDRQVKCLLSSKPKAGPYAVTVGEIEKAIQRLTVVRDGLA